MDSCAGLAVACISKGDLVNAGKAIAAARAVYAISRNNNKGNSSLANTEKSPVGYRCLPAEIIGIPVESYLVTGVVHIIGHTGYIGIFKISIIDG